MVLATGAVRFCDDAHALGTRIPPSFDHNPYRRVRLCRCWGRARTRFLHAPAWGQPIERHGASNRRGGNAPREHRLLRSSRTLTRLLLVGGNRRGLDGTLRDGRCQPRRRHVGLMSRSGEGSEETSDFTFGDARYARARTLMTFRRLETRIACSCC